MVKKTIISLLIAVVLTITLVTPISAAAPTAEDPMFWCFHNKNGHRTVTNSIVPKDDVYHTLYIDDITYCTSCGKEMVIQPYIIDEGHKSVVNKLISINHVGAFDIYTYADVCGVCSHQFNISTSKKPCDGSCEIPLY